MTLGCHFREGKLIYDQLEYSNNRKAEALVVEVAVQFIAWLNSQLSLLKWQLVSLNFFLGLTFEEKIGRL